MAHGTQKTTELSSPIMLNTVSWRSPSNIALVKYWGKHGVQLPRNASLSFTLSQAFSETRIDFMPRSGKKEDIDLSFYFEGAPKPVFEKKIRDFFSGITSYFPFLHDFRFEIHSHNSFPHSTGIASSASGMSAIALGLCHIESLLGGSAVRDRNYWQKASEVARLGSGSACRSVYGGFAVWGKHPAVPASSDQWAVPISEQVIHPVFQDYQDSILIIRAGEKSVSSRAGHKLMERHTFGSLRFEQAHQNLSALLEALASGDLEHFTEIVEEEALTLHALMMTSRPSYILLQPNTLAAIERIRHFRYTTNIPLSFTLDAGPNLHLLYPKADQKQIHAFIISELEPLCQEGKWIEDEVGRGPIEL